MASRRCVPQHQSPLRNCAICWPAACVIGGSSAGATIQGSYLARGDAKTNTIMMGDHEEGFGFLKNAAIDQHLLRRNRQFDLLEVIRARPELLGIGIDEDTAIVVDRRPLRGDRAGLRGDLRRQAENRYGRRFLFPGAGRPLRPRGAASVPRAPRPPRAGRRAPMTVGIAGASGAGKTTFAKALAARLPAAALLSTDAYYCDLARLPPAERAAVNFDLPETIGLGNAAGASGRAARRAVRACPPLRFQDAYAPGRAANRRPIRGDRPGRHLRALASPGARDARSRRLRRYGRCRLPGAAHRAGYGGARPHAAVRPLAVGTPHPADVPPAYLPDAPLRRFHPSTARPRPRMRFAACSLPCAPLLCPQPPG